MSDIAAFTKGLLGNVDTSGIGASLGGGSASQQMFIMNLVAKKKAAALAKQKAVLSTKTAIVKALNIEDGPRMEAVLKFLGPSLGMDDKAMKPLIDVAKTLTRQQRGLMAEAISSGEDPKEIGALMSTAAGRVKIYERITATGDKKVLEAKIDEALQGVDLQDPQAMLQAASNSNDPAVADEIRKMMKSVIDLKSEGRADAAEGREVAGEARAVEEHGQATLRREQVMIESAEDQELQAQKADREADAATQTSILQEIEIAQRQLDLEQDEFNAQFTDTPIGKREKSFALAAKSGSIPRMNRALDGLVSAVQKEINAAKGTEKAITVRSTRDGNAVLAAGKEDQQGNITVLEGNSWRPLKDGEFKYTARGTVGEAGVTTAEKSQQQALGRFARGTFRELRVAVDMISKSTNADFGIGGAIRKGLGAATAPFKKKPLFRDFKNLQVQLNTIRATLAETFKADPRRFNENARKDAKALIPLAGEFFETKGGAMKRLQVLQALLANRLADVSEAGLPVGVSGIQPEDIRDLVASTPLTEAGATRLVLTLFPKRFPK